ncbi:MAG: hypothetical protein ACI8RZ_004850 [Myxococcota bacterium]|jgi:hypothetical protein
MLLALTSLIGCAPQDAEVTAHWFTWLAANSSPSVSENSIDSLLETSTAFECSGRGWDRDEGEWEKGYIGPGNELLEATTYIGGACDPDDGGCDEGALETQCEDINNAYYHTFLQDDGYYAMQGKVEPYRTDAYLNSENDFQLTVHQRLDDGEDFRFQFSIAPDFAPVECIDEDGTTVVRYVDDAEWVNQWSDDEEGYSIFFLNAGSYQRNPSDDDDYWYLISDWNSGFGSAKFSSDEFASLPGEYGDYEHLDVYGGAGNSARDTLFADSGHFLAVSDRSDLTNSAVSETYASYADELNNYAESWGEEMSSIAGATSEDGTYTFTQKVEDNQWRPLDTGVSGLDGWMELHHSWVRIKDGATFEVGSAIEGDFQILMGGIDSASRMVVTGSFKVESLREDNNGYPYLEDEKRGDNSTPFCSGATVE